MTESQTPATPTGPVRHGSGAASRRTEDWNQIDWRQAERTVRRLQARIVKATHEGRWNKVRALQRLLTHSYSGKALAVKRVTANRGKRTPGVDGETWTTPRQKVTAIRHLRQRGYTPQPLRRVYIPKKTGKVRPLGIPTMRDRAMQALHLLTLSPIAETTGDQSSYGFRPCRSTHDAIARCHLLLSKRASPRWVLEGDIRACFDWISHDWLLAHVPMDRSILRKWLKAGFVDKRILFPTEDGTPQGGIISPTLANLALDGLHALLRERFPYRARHKVNLVRYADDFIITGASKEVLEAQVRPLVEQFLMERGLALSLDKTVITHIDQGFDFLGKNIRKYRGKLLIKPSKAAVSSVLRDARGIFRNSGSLTAGQLIQRLNPLLRGWAYYHRHGVSSRTFEAVDNHIWHGLLRWARRRHKDKSSRWIGRKYFLPHEGRRNVFTGTVGPHTAPRTVRITRTASIPIRRHVLVRGEANPLDPNWNAYFAQRRKRPTVAAVVSPRPVTRAVWKA
ncbi:MAG: group II intron reverse transcriptase/maturase [Pseudonocardiaceae bacterium]